MSRSLFLLRRREDYGYDSAYSASPHLATGMWNSARFVEQTLKLAGREAETAILPDANSIDAAVTSYNPDFVFIEGLWVTPAKFVELLSIPRHQSRTWVVRIHSEIPFLAGEGIAMDWIGQYLQLGIKVAPNGQRAHQQLKWYAQGLVTGSAAEHVIYLPNPYPDILTSAEPAVGLDTTSKPTLDIACFGAFRPLKNHLQQLFIASRFAASQGKGLRFHVNSRIDSGGAPAAKNVKATAQQMGITLVEHAWEDRPTFLQSLRDTDLLLQVSMSETFNIVAADAVLVGTPILVSSEIPWAVAPFADPQDVDASLKALDIMWRTKPMFVQNNQRSLRRYHLESTRIWLALVPA